MRAHGPGQELPPRFQEGFHSMQSPFFGYLFDTYMMQVPFHLCDKTFGLAYKTFRFYGSKRNSHQVIILHLTSLAYSIVDLTKLRGDEPRFYQKCTKCRLHSRMSS